jgi:hypothetical protein
MFSLRGRLRSAGRSYHRSSTTALVTDSATDRSPTHYSALLRVPKAPKPEKVPSVLPTHYWEWSASSRQCLGSTGTVLLVSAADFDAACANLTHPTDTITLSATPLTPDGEGGYTADPSPSPVHSVSPQDWVVRRGECGGAPAAACQATAVQCVAAAGYRSEHICLCKGEALQLGEAGTLVHCHAVLFSASRKPAKARMK